MEFSLNHEIILLNSGSPYRFILLAPFILRALYIFRLIRLDIVFMYMFCKHIVILCIVDGLSEILKIC